MFSRSASATSFSLILRSSTGAKPIIGPPPSFPHCSGFTPGCAAKPTSTAMACVGSARYAPVTAPCPPTSSRVLQRNVTRQRGFFSASICAQRTRTATLARLSRPGAETRVAEQFLRLRAEHDAVARVHQLLARSSGVQPMSTAILEISGTSSSLPPVRWGGMQQTTPQSVFFPNTVTAVPGRTRRSIPPHRSTRRKPLSSTFGHHQGRSGRGARPQEYAFSRIPVSHLRSQVSECIRASLGERRKFAFRRFARCRLIAGGSRRTHRRNSISFCSSGSSSRVSSFIISDFISSLITPIRLRFRGNALRVSQNSGTCQSWRTRAKAKQCRRVPHGRGKATRLPPARKRAG